MLAKALSRGVVAATLALGLSASLAPAQVTLQLINTLDGASGGLSFGDPGSIAAYGDRLYVGTLDGSSSQITQINNPLGAPTNAGTLSGAVPPAGNGYVTLNTDGSTVVAATDGNQLQVYDVASGALRYESNAAGLPGASRSSIDGAAIDPLTGNVWVTGFNSDAPNVLSSTSLTDVSDNPTSLQAGTPTSSGWKDLAFAPNGDLYLRATNGVAAGVRVGSTDDFTTIPSLGATEGISQIVGGGGANLQEFLQSALNVEFLPASFTGTEDLILANTRPFLPAEPVPFADSVLAFDADAGFDGSTPGSLDEAGVAAAISFVGSDGVTPFMTSGSLGGVYDFSFDPVNEVLYVSDFDNGAIYLFGQVSVPTGIAGDYNNDGAVDAADYTLWRDANGTPAALPNDTTPGAVGPGDYTVWADNYGATAAAATAIPEPASVLLACLISGVGLARRR